MLKRALPVLACVIVTSVAGADGVFAASAEAAPAAAASDSLSGTWSGGGSVTFGSGSQERARCRATYSRESKTSYNVSATCATPSGKVSQSAVVRGSGSSYRGSFYNPEFDATGSIQITVHGRSQTVRLSGTKGSALLRLSK